MKVVILPKTQKELDKLNEPIKSRIKKAVAKLSNEPPQGDIRQLSGNTGQYRLRVGDYRVLFKIHENVIVIHEIGLRGQVYKRR